MVGGLKVLRYAERAIPDELDRATSPLSVIPLLLGVGFSMVFYSIFVLSKLVCSELTTETNLCEFRTWLRAKELLHCLAYGRS